MKRKYSKIEYIFFWMVSLVCATSGYRFFTENTEHTAHAAKPGRAIASQGARAKIVAPDSKKLSEFEGNRPFYLGCKDDGVKYETTANQIRIVGPYCMIQSEIEIKVTNSRTGYVAMVFNEATDKKFSTDFISLEPGKNKIDVVTKSSDGKTLEQHLVVDRK